MSPLPPFDESVPHSMEFVPEVIGDAYSTAIAVGPSTFTRDQYAWLSEFNGRAIEVLDALQNALEAQPGAQENDAAAAVQGALLGSYAIRLLIERGSITESKVRMNQNIAFQGGWSRLREQAVDDARLQAVFGPGITEALKRINFDTARRFCAAMLLASLVKPPDTDIQSGSQVRPDLQRIRERRQSSRNRRRRGV